MDVLKYLGRPWIAGEYDCWSLVRDVYLNELGVDLPLVPVYALNLREVIEEFQSSDIFGLFEVIDSPVPMCVAGMTRSASERMTHVGVYLVDESGNERVLHNAHNTGVVCQSINDLPSKGLKIQGFYQYANDC